METTGRTYRSAQHNYDANYVNAMAVDTANNLWVGSNYGLRKFAPGNNSTFTLYDTSNSPLPSDYILDVKADPNGGIWIGTAAGLGAFRWDDLDDLQSGKHRNARHRCR